MGSVTDPIFKDRLKNISWKKIYSREYGVQYSEMAVLCLSGKAKYHIPKPSSNQIIIPEGNNTAFYIDNMAWVELVESLNKKYTSNLERLKKYEWQFNHDGKVYLEKAKKLTKLNVAKLNNKQLKEQYLDYQQKLFTYSVFAWTSFILNNYIAEKATVILDKYIEKNHATNRKQEIYDSLFKPEKKAAILKLQHEAKKQKLEVLYEKYKWLSCLDLHNKPWTKEEFSSQLKSLTNQTIKKITPFKVFSSELKISNHDLQYLLMAKRFVYIKDARDDFRRRGVFFALNFFKEISKRMGFSPEDISYLQTTEIVNFLENAEPISNKVIDERKKGFVMYLAKKGNVICLQGEATEQTITNFGLQKFEENKTVQITGRVASQGKAIGKVSIVNGVKDLAKVQVGDVLVAVTTHPDYVSVMRKAVAIITDEGGITSHAAIVSREFGVPCIVGTKNATTVLKDGDKVEVDAINGWVKKL